MQLPRLPQSWLARREEGHTLVTAHTGSRQQQRGFDSPVPSEVPERRRWKGGVGRVAAEPTKPQPVLRPGSGPNHREVESAAFECRRSCLGLPPPAAEADDEWPGSASEGRDPGRPQDSLPPWMWTRSERGRHCHSLSDSRSLNLRSRLA
ncbi:hypothetical protein H920_12729 [Fukomys damarensis]|uniref:Uncharacterized protein n=1 Tax=Fukomys damarensis TaxID=885580 RepID=A0A091DSQ0_FUKDA|nr:hypothetical protein H920_12729 [Fukomys damarensis]